MRRAVMMVAAVVLVASAAFAQGSYYVGYYSNVAGKDTKTLENVIWIVNVGVGGDPLSSPVGDVCASLYVFDSKQEMIGCCACYLTPNQVAYASVGRKPTGKPGTSFAGAVSIVSAAAVPPGGSSSCAPTIFATNADANLVRVFGARVQATDTGVFITESESVPSALSSAQNQFLPTACSFLLGIGRNNQICSCSSPGTG